MTRSSGRSCPCSRSWSATASAPIPTASADFSKELDRSLEGLTREIYALAGEEFNLGSPKQLATILFEKLGLPPVKKTKTGYSTDADVLEQLAISATRCPRSSSSTARSPSSSPPTPTRCRG